MIPVLTPFQSAIRIPQSAMRMTAVVWLFAVTPATAQQAVAADDLLDRLPVHRIEVAAAGLWLSGASLGSSDASLRTNQTGATTAPYRLFDQKSRLGSAAGLEARVGVSLSRAWSIEGAFMFSRPQVRTALSDDVEGTSPLTARDRIDQYVVDGGVTRHLRRWRVAGHGVPFLSAGVGYLRQLHQGQYLIETGQIYRAGGGLAWWLASRNRGFGRAAALRVDGRVYVPRGGFEFERRTRVHGAIGASILVVF